MIEEKRDQDVFLTVLGFGYGNYQDAKMEQLADKGNGNYAYIDNVSEARKVLVGEIGATLVTIAKDVKLQIEFNPTKVQAYRLIGYENRMLRSEDFKDDTKDAGELGAGHSVTALYELVPAGVTTALPQADSLKYQITTIRPEAFRSDEWMTVKFRYKDPNGTKSKLISRLVTGPRLSLSETSDNFRFAASVAGFGMMLRDSEHKGEATYAGILEMARGARGKDSQGYRSEFIGLVEKASQPDIRPYTSPSVSQSNTSPFVSQSNISSSVSIGTIRSDTRSDTAIRQVARQNMGPLRFCYRRELKGDPTLQGNMKLQLTIKPNGRVTKLVLISDTIGSRNLNRCVQGRMRAWRFPPVAEGTTAGTAEMSLEFQK